MARVKDRCKPNNSASNEHDSTNSISILTCSTKKQVHTSAVIDSDEKIMLLPVSQRQSINNITQNATNGKHN